MATTPTLAASALSLDDYLHTSYEPDCDFVDGWLEERNVGEREHSILQVALGAWFFNRGKQWKIRVMSEQRTRVSQGRVRLPDLCLVSADAPPETVTETPPIVAIEILSREDRLPRVLARMDDFLSMGVQNLWLIDPLDRVAYTYTAAGLRLVTGTRIEVANSPIFLDLAEVFSALD